MTAAVRQVKIPEFISGLQRASFEAAAKIKETSALPLSAAVFSEGVRGIKGEAVATPSGV